MNLTPVFVILDYILRMLMKLMYMIAAMNGIDLDGLITTTETTTAETTTAAETTTVAP